MKILYICAANSGSGYYNSAIDFIIALDGIGLDVAARFVNFGGQPKELSEIVKKCVAKDLNDVTHCVQHTLPHHFEYKKGIKNLGLFFWETSNFNNSSWPEFVNMMDGIICPNLLTWNVASHYNDSTFHINQPININKFDDIKPLDIPLLNNAFDFYTIAENVRRKNLHTLIRAFHHEFGPDEPVNLVIKTSLSGASPEESLNYTKQMCIDIQNNLKIYKNPVDYKKEIIITDNLSDKQILGLHLNCDCFIMPSYGEGYCLPLYDAILAEKHFLCTNNAGMIDNTVHSIPSHKEVVFGNTNTFLDLYTGNEQWSAPSAVKLAQMMRTIYNDKFTIDTSIRNNILKYNNYKAVGEKFKKVLEMV